VRSRTKMRNKTSTRKVCLAPSQLLVVLLTIGWVLQNLLTTNRVTSRAWEVSSWINSKFFGPTQMSTTIKKNTHRDMILQQWTNRYKTNLSLPIFYPGAQTESERPSVAKSTAMQTLPRKIFLKFHGLIQLTKLEILRHYLMCAKPNRDTGVAINWTGQLPAVDRQQCAGSGAAGDGASRSMLAVFRCSHRSDETAKLQNRAECR